MKIATRQQGDFTVMELDGDMDRLTVGDFQQALNSLLRSGQVRVVIDLAKLLFIDSTGLGTLVSSALTARKSSGFIRLAAINERISRVFELTHMSRGFEIFGTVEEAVKAPIRTKPDEKMP